MKSVLSKQLAYVFFIFTVLASCSKQPLEQIPTPGEPVPTTSGVVSFSVNQDLNGAPYHSSNLTAVVTIVNKQNTTVVNEKTLTLTLNGSIKSESLSLPQGTYKLTQFRLVYGGMNTHFAAPIAGSAKAANLQKPLAFEFTVSAASSVVPVDVLKVSAGEGPQQFGYPAGSFDSHQEENNPYMNVKIKASMQIGDVLYDSIPAALTVTTWNQQGEMSTSYVSLKAGINQVPLPKAAKKFKFLVSKWGTNDEMTLDRAQVDTVTVYSLGGSKAAKKLKSELTYALDNGRFVAESKIDYAYDIQGRLFRVYHYKRDAANRPYLSLAENFQYNGNRLEKISRLNGKSETVGSTEFAYDQQGKVIKMIQEEDSRQITATVTYHYGPLPGASIHYTYSDQTYTVDHALLFSGGNTSSDTQYVAGDLSQTTYYEYDGGINPYLHMAWPDLSLSRMTKNNVVKQTGHFYTHMPQVEPYDFSYTYDADGYPKELVKKWRALPGRQYTKTTKTVFEY